MVEGRHHQLQPQLLLHHPRPRSRLGGRSRAGEIVKVQGGHIVRATGRKDRHSKVFTAKGPRDRRVRLSAHTAIQFYDVQDRLGYDRPSKAVDWLIKHAKGAIDQLAELPPWCPTVAASSPPLADEGENHDDVAEHTANSSSYGYGASCILPPSLDSDAIADTIRFFFPPTDAAAASSSPMLGGFQCYPPDLQSRTSSSHAQDLRLSLQSFQDTLLLQHQRSAAVHHHPTSPTADQGMYPNSPASLAFDSASANLSDQNPRMVPWGIAARGVDGVDANGGAYMVHPPLPPLHSMLGLSPFLPPRGTLQSSNSAWARALMDPINAGDPIAPLSFPATDRPSGGFSEYHIPARIQGDEEEHDGVSNGPSSASSASRH